MEGEGAGNVDACRWGCDMRGATQSARSPGLRRVYERGATEPTELQGQGMQSGGHVLGD